MNRLMIHKQLHLGLWLALLPTIPFNLKVSAIALAFLVLNRVLAFRVWKGLPSQPLLIWGLLCMVYFLYSAGLSLYSEDVSAAFKVAERKSAFLLLPGILLTTPSHFFRLSSWKILSLAGSLALAGMVFIILAVFRYLGGAGVTTFFYHDLLSPLGQHAVYYSALAFLSLVMLQAHSPSRISLLIQAVLLIFIVLLSSKLILAITLIYLLFRAFNTLKRRSGKLIMIGSLGLVVLLLSLIPNPIRSRFTDISLDRFQYINADHIGEDVYLDGLTLRLLQVRLGIEILAEQEAWFSGVGNLKDQQLLNAKYASLELYMPESGEDRGFHDYNFHNQYMQSFVQGGILMLLVLIAIFISNFYLAITQRNHMLFWGSLLFAGFSLSESILERQQGVMAFICYTILFISQPDPSGLNRDQTRDLL